LRDVKRLPIFRAGFRVGASHPVFFPTHVGSLNERQGRAVFAAQENSSLLEGRIPDAAGNAVVFSAGFVPCFNRQNGAGSPGAIRILWKRSVKSHGAHFVAVFQVVFSKDTFFLQATARFY
jgi:hypothetical protein